VGETTSAVDAVAFVENRIAEFGFATGSWSVTVQGATLTAIITSANSGDVQAFVLEAIPGPVIQVRPVLSVESGDSALDANGPGRFVSTGGEVLLVGPEVVLDTDSAEAVNFDGQAMLTLNFTDAGSENLNGAAAECFDASAKCPTRRLAMFVDDRLVSSPNIAATDFGGSSVISDGFSLAEMERLARAINAASDVDLVEIDRAFDSAGSSE